MLKSEKIILWYEGTFHTPD